MLINSCTYVCVQCTIGQTKVSKFVVYFLRFSNQLFATLHLLYMCYVRNLNVCVGYTYIIGNLFVVEMFFY